MNRLLGFLKKNKSKLAIALDIGSYSIKTAVFEISAEDKQITSINKKIFYLPLFASGDGLEDSKVTASRIREIIFNFLKELKRVPDKIIIGFDSPLAESKITAFKIPAEKSKQKISKEELDDLFNSVINEENKKLTGEGKAIILSYPIATLLDGYEISDFEGGLHCEEIIFKTFIFYLDSRGANDFLAIPQMLGGIPVEFSSIIFSLGKSVSKKMPDGKDCAILDIGGLHTHLIIIRDGKISEIAAFPSGGFNFTKSLSREIGVEIEQSSQLKKQYAQGIATKKETEKITNVFIGESAVWEEKFISALGDTLTTDFFPKILYVVGGGANIPEIKKVLEAKKWTSHILLSGDIAIITVGAEDILGGKSITPILKGPDEAGLASLIVNFNN